MPECYKEKIDNKKQIVVWDITESEIELYKDLSLSKNALFNISQRKSIVHRKGYLAIRQILKNLNIDFTLFQYDQNGAPYLTDGRYISIQKERIHRNTHLNEIPYLRQMTLTFARATHICMGLS